MGFYILTVWLLRFLENIRKNKNYISCVQFLSMKDDKNVNVISIILRIDYICKIQSLLVNEVASYQSCR